MILHNLRKVLTLSKNRLAHPERIKYSEAENEFTSEGAPLPVSSVKPEAASEVDPDGL